MSAALQESDQIDPSRPWLIDPEQDPSRQNWLSTLFDPTGESSKLHFTRAWTLLFMLQFLSVFGVGMIVFVVGLAGADTDGLSVGAAYFAAGVYLVTSLFSLVIHCRRLNHAKRFPLFAILVALPLAISLVVTLQQVNQSAAVYDEMYQSRSAFIDNPSAFRETALERRREENANRAERSPDNRSDRRGRGGNTEDYNPEDELPGQEEFILRPHVSGFYFMILGLSILIVPWSLMWVARARPR
ncbi:MAG: hypothetical protein AAGJ84_07000 [Pseudomonadota bacterium]